LYYFRGEYNRAIDMLFATRRACEKSGDAYHFALCHLDLSEIYLELNLSEEAREMARQGVLLFQKLGMGYETAKNAGERGDRLRPAGKHSPGARAIRASPRDIRPGKKTSSGRGSSICIRDSCDFMRDATSKRGNSAWARRIL